MSVSSGIIFKPPVVVLTNSLRGGDEYSRVAKELAHRPIPSFPPRSLSQIIVLIRNGHIEAITIMEWLYIFQEGFEYESGEKEESNEICVLLWQAIFSQRSVKHIALFKAAQYLDSQQTNYPKMLIKTLDLAISFADKQDQLRLNWLVSIRDKEYKKSANDAYVMRYPPVEYMKALGFPTSATYRNNVLKEVVRVLPKDIDGYCSQWLLASFKEMTYQELLYNCEQLICSNKAYCKQVEDWVKSKCLPDSKDSYWYDLTDNSRKLLKKRYALSNYYHFSQLASIICYPVIAKALKLTEQEVKQIQSRAAFWQNYSDEFNRIKILLPYETSKLVLTSLNIDKENIITLPDVETESSEVCVFELSNQIIVEVFRGSSSEIRIFEKSARNEQRLLNDRELTLSKIRNMLQDYVHDHVLLWQYYCEKMLRTNLNILPNVNTQYFKGIPKRFSNYCNRTGLPVPSDSLIQQRLEQLEKWNDTFWEREFKTEEYKDMSSADISASKDYQVAIQAKLLGEEVKFKKLIRKSAENGHVPAMYMFGLSLISDPKNNLELKKSGEQWVCMAAEKGHIKATEMVQKYNLKSDLRQLRVSTKGYFGLSVNDLKMKVRKNNENEEELLSIKQELLRRDNSASKALLVMVNNYLTKIDNNKIESWTK